MKIDNYISYGTSPRVMPCLARVAAFLASCRLKLPFGSQFLFLKNLQIPQQIRKNSIPSNFSHTNSDQYSRGDFHFYGIFSTQPPSHSGFLKINGINRSVTFPTRIQLLKTCDLIAGMDTNAITATSEKSGKNSRATGAFQPRRSPGVLVPVPAQTNN